MYPKPNDILSGIWAHDLNKALTARGINIKVICPIPYVPKILQNNPKRKGYSHFPLTQEIDGLTVYYPRILTAPGRAFHGITIITMYFALLPFVKSLITSWRPNVLHSHAATPAGCVSAYIGKKLFIPTVCTLHGSDINVYPHYDPLTYYLTYKVINKSDQIASVSMALKIAAEGIAKPKHEIKVIHNGCDLQKFRFDLPTRIQMRNFLCIPEDSISLIFVGNLLKEKGIVELLTAFRELATIYNKLHLILVGDGPALKLVQTAMRYKDLTTRIHVTGLVMNDRIQDFLSAADIFVLPSYLEGFPTVIKEAMACSMPIIATTVGGIPELIQHGINGLLIPPRNVDSLKASIIECIANSDMRKQMGISNRAVMEKQYTVAHCANQYISVYKKLMDISTYGKENG